MLNVKIYQTRQYGETEVTVQWDENSYGVYTLDGKYTRGNQMPNYLQGRYKLTEQDQAAIQDAIANCAKTGETTTLTFTMTKKQITSAPKTEWTSPRGLTLAQEMEREDTDY